MTYVSHALRHDKLARSIMDAEQTHDLQAAGPRKPGGSPRPSPESGNQRTRSTCPRAGAAGAGGACASSVCPFPLFRPSVDRIGTRPGPTSSVRTVFLLSLPSETLNSSGINHHNSRKQAKPGRNPDVWFAAEAFAVTTHPCFPKEDSGDLGRSLPRGPQDVAGSQLTVYTSHEMASCHGPSSVLCIARRATAPPAPTR